MRSRQVKERVAVIAVMVVAVAVSLFALVNVLQAQSGNGIYEPADGDSVNGIVVVRGTAAHPQFLRYELAFLQLTSPGSEWIVFAQGDQPVRDDSLAVWDTTVGQPVAPIFPDGQYRLRLRVVRQDYNYDEYFVSNILINNLSATPSPTTTVTATLASPPSLPGATELEATRRAGTQILPTLTPFPTPSPLPTAAPGDPGQLGGPDGEADSQQGLLSRILAIETSLFGRAFWLGVGLVFAVFSLLAIYILLRGGWRWLRRNVRRGSG